MPERLAVVVSLFRSAFETRLHILDTLKRQGIDENTFKIRLILIKRDRHAHKMRKLGAGRNTGLCKKLNQRKMGRVGSHVIANPAEGVVEAFLA